MATVAILETCLPCLLARVLDTEAETAETETVLLTVGEQTLPATVVSVGLDEAAWIDAVVAEFASLQSFLRERV